MPGWVPTREELIEMLADADTRRRLSGGAAAKKKKKSSKGKKKKKSKAASKPRRSPRIAKSKKKKSKAASKKKSKKSPKKKPCAEGKTRRKSKSGKIMCLKKRTPKKKGSCKRGKHKVNGRCVKKNRKSRQPCTPSRSGLARSRRNSAGLLSSKRRCTIDRLSTVNRGACRARTRAGINRAVWEGRCAATPSGLTKTDLMVSKSTGKIVSKKKSAQAKKILNTKPRAKAAFKAQQKKMKSGLIRPKRRSKKKSPRKAPATARRPARKPRKSASATKAKSSRRSGRTRRAPSRLGYAGM